MAHITADEHGKTIIADPWSIEDIESMAQRIDINITEAQCEVVMHRIVDNFDANIGINWDVIEYHIRDVIKGSVL